MRGADGLGCSRFGRAITRAIIIINYIGHYTVDRPLHDHDQ